MSDIFLVIRETRHTVTIEKITASEDLAKEEAKRINSQEDGCVYILRCVERCVEIGF